MSETEEDLKATAEAITVEARRLVAIEEAKLELDPKDPVVPVLSAESQEIARRLVVQTRVEGVLATTLADSLPD